MWNWQSHPTNIIEVVFSGEHPAVLQSEPCFQIVPELVSWKPGSYRPVKRLRPVHNVLQFLRRQKHAANAGFMSGLAPRSSPEEYEGEPNAGCRGVR